MRQTCAVRKLRPKAAVLAKHLGFADHAETWTASVGDHLANRTRGNVLVRVGIFDLWSWPTTSGG